MSDELDHAVYELTDAQIERITERASKRALDEFIKTHGCQFNKYAGHLHAFGEACIEHEIKPGDLMVMVFSAKTATGLVKRAAAGFLICLAVVVLYLFSGQWVKDALGIVK